jgi:hypothetical protein
MVFVTDFKNNSPFADMIPHWTQMFLHPIAFTQTCVEVLRLQTAKNTAETMERRKRKVEDVQKRAAFRKAHGLDTNDGFGGWTAKRDDQGLGPVIPVADLTGDEGQQVDQERQRRPAIKKWFGIW